MSSIAMLDTQKRRSVAFNKRNYADTVGKQHVNVQSGSAGQNLKPSSQSDELLPEQAAPVSHRDTGCKQRVNEQLESAGQRDKASIRPCEVLAGQADENQNSIHTLSDHATDNGDGLPQLEKEAITQIQYPHVPNISGAPTAA